MKFWKLLIGWSVSRVNMLGNPNHIEWPAYPHLKSFSAMRCNWIVLRFMIPEEKGTGFSQSLIEPRRIT